MISNIRIRDIDEVAEMRDVEELQKEVWGIPDLDVVPLTQLVAAKEAGGVLIGAYDGESLVGFVYGFPSYEHGKLAHHSHMLAVKPAYRNFDLGRQLKLAQRDRVVAQGVELISWTFDPLQSLNAHFNFNKLGVIADRYLMDFYGEEPASFLHQTGTDRLWVSWFVARERPIAGEDQVAIEIPSDINALSLEAALEWRAKTRQAFTEALAAGYIVTSFNRDQSSGKYLLTKR
jgi:predicted GNAT superfamily acetyltransferase